MSKIKTTMKQTCLITILILMAIMSYAQKEHLEPVRDFEQFGGVLKEYYGNVFPILYKDFVEKPFARYTSMPSFSNEYAFSVEIRETKYYIISNALSESYWYAKNRKKVKLLNKKTEINEGLYLKIGALFRLLAEQTRKPENETIGIDGVTYYFATTDTMGEVRLGEIWSPLDNTLLKKLVEICDTIHSVGNGKNISQADLENAIEQLINDLNK